MPDPLIVTWIAFDAPAPKSPKSADAANREAFCVVVIEHPLAMPLKRLPPQIAIPE